jgi:putative aldouronate transport system permease protein
MKSISLGRIIRSYQLYLFILPTLVYFLIFHYMPMYGMIIAFKSFSPNLGYWGSPWVGLDNFERFFSSPQFWSLIRNTLLLSIYTLAAGFPLPIILAIALHYVPSKPFKKVVQTATYAPHFISVVVIVGMTTMFLSPRTGIVNHLLGMFGAKPIFFMSDPDMFQSIYVWSGVWQSAGWNSIIYLAALSTVDTSLHESAKIDGAGIMKRIWHIDIKGILPTIIILLIMNTGHIMTVGFEKAFLMQNALNLSSSEIISTYVYKVGIIGGQFSFSTAVGLFNSVVNFILLLFVNKAAKKFSETSLW